MAEENKEFPGAGDVDDIMSLVDDVTGESKQDETDDDDGVKKPAAEEDDGESLDEEAGEIPSDVNDLLDDEEEEDENKADTEEDDDDLPEEPEGLTEKEATAFRTMRTKIAELKAQVKEQVSAVSNEQAEKLQKELSDLKARMSATDLAQTDEFKAKYTNPIRETQAELVRIAKEYDIDENVAISAARMSRSERIKTLRNNAIDELAVSELMPIYQELEKRISAGKDALANHEQTRQELQTQAEARQEQLQGETFSNTLKALQAEHFLLRESKANPKWLNAITHNAKLVLSGKTQPEKIVESALKAQVADAYKKMYVDLKTSTDAKIAELESKYGKIKKSAPKLGDRNDTKSPKSKPKDNMTIEDLVDETVSSIANS